MMNEIRLIYKAAVDAVKPSALVSWAVRRSENVVHIQEDLTLELNQNCHVIGSHLIHYSCQTFFNNESFKDLEKLF